MAANHHYSQEFRLQAVARLEAVGYPRVHRAIQQIAEEMRVPESTLRSWWRKFGPLEADASQMIGSIYRRELLKVVEKLDAVRDSATYPELIAVLRGLVADLRALKVQEKEQGPNVQGARQRLHAAIAGYYEREGAAHDPGEPVGRGSVDSAV